MVLLHTDKVITRARCTLHNQCLADDPLTLPVALRPSLHTTLSRVHATPYPTHTVGSASFARVVATPRARVPMALAVALLGSLGACPTITLNASAFHVTFAHDTPCFVSRDVHFLTGVIRPEGGNASVKVANGTVPDFTLVFSNGECHAIGNVTTSGTWPTNASMVCNGSTVSLHGFGTFENELNELIYEMGTSACTG